jgi:uncharacterized damage-inducible protein DinB
MTRARTQAVYFAEIAQAHRETRQMTFDLLDALTAEQLSAPLPRPDLDTFGKHFQELGDTQESYALAIDSGVIDFSTIRTEIDYELVASKARLRQFLEAKDREMEALLVGRSGDEMIRWEDDEAITLVEHLSRMIRHELFHQGQLAAYAYLLKIPFPNSWISAWVLPAKKGQLYSN